MPLNYSTVDYKTVDELEIRIDIYHPVELSAKPIPALVYFHGGGLTVGDRESWFPQWMYRRVVDAGIAFISADYRLMPSGGVTGHQILEDVKDLFAFIADQTFSDPITNKEYTIDGGKLLTAGTSAGGLCSYLAAIHAIPQPVAVLSMYGMGANFLAPHCLAPKTKTFFRGRELLDPSDPKFQEFLYPACRTTPQISASPLEYFPASSPTPNYPANPRMLLARLYLQLGNVLDYYTGEDQTTSITPDNKALFPQANVSSSWPPTLIIHGENDTAIPVDESKFLLALLKEAGVSSELIVVPGCEHSFDYADDNEEKFGEIFEKAITFLKDHAGVV